MQRADDAEVWEAVGHGGFALNVWTEEAGQAEGGETSAGGRARKGAQTVESMSAWRTPFRL